jgi:hypothetical protein
LEPDDDYVEAQSDLVEQATEVNLNNFNKIKVSSRKFTFKSSLK